MPARDPRVGPRPPKRAQPRVGDQRPILAPALRPAGTPDASVVAPLLSYVIVPYEPDHGAAQVAGLVALAEVVRPVWGMMSVEPSYDIAQLAALAKGPPRDQRGTFPLLTEDRIRYRRAPWHHDKQIDRGIGGPEWGTFLGPRHLEKLSLEDVRSSGAFAQVHLLAYGGAFLQLTGDPSDSQSERIVDLVARGRVALSAITLDVSAVRL